MSAQHVRPGRSGKRARRERAGARLEYRIIRLKKLLAMEADKAYWTPFYEKTIESLRGEVEHLKSILAQPLRPIPPKQTRKLTR